jgi:hypothetical protein
MPEKLACVVTRANLSGIAFIFELKYHPKYEKGKYLLSFFNTFKLSENTMWILTFWQHWVQTTQDED